MSNKIIDKIGYIGDRIEDFFCSWNDRGFIAFRCPACNGSGGEESVDEEPWTCDFCDGTGTVGIFKKIRFMFYNIEDFYYKMKWRENKWVNHPRP